MLKEGLLVVLLAYKEAENLDVLLPQIMDEVGGLGVDYGMLVVDAATPGDNSEEVCNKYGAKYINQEDPGFGGAFRTAIKYADRKMFLILDADGSHNPKYIPSMYEMFVNDKCDLVIGSRYTKGGKTFDSKSSIVMSKMLNTAFRVCLGIKAKDISTDFRLYDTEQLKKVSLQNKNYDVLQEVIFKLQRNNKRFKIGEVPISFEKRIFGESKRHLIPYIISYIKSLVRLTTMRIRG
ncbi:dolichol-phosphate mannosyltransferase [Butyrivibrio sp. ob235]|nr:dolichol-phosphate mannosyltransferase [Butyrivibrio sp. ob235]